MAPRIKLTRSTDAAIERASRTRAIIPVGRANAPRNKNARPGGIGKPVLFKKGHAKKGGRKKGSENKISRVLKEAIILAAATVGRDGKGKDGLDGYLVTCAKMERVAYMGLLKAVLPYYIQGNVAHSHRVFRSKEEVIKDLRNRGIPVETIYNNETDVFEPANDYEAEHATDTVDDDEGLDKDDADAA